MDHKIQNQNQKSKSKSKFYLTRYMAILISVAEKMKEVININHNLNKQSNTLKETNCMCS